MASFLVYTYQFQRLIAQKQLELNFSFDSSEKSQWDLRQQNFSSLFVPGNKLRMTHDRFVFQCIVKTNQDGIIVLQIGKKDKDVVRNKNLEKVHVTNFKTTVVIFDNREDVQRLLLQNQVTAKESQQAILESLTHTLDKLMMRRFKMHFTTGDVPNYSINTFWNLLEKKNRRFKKLCFSIPPLNLGRLISLSDGINQLREETGGGLDLDIKAPAKSWLKLEHNHSTQTEGLIALSAACGKPITAYPYNSKEKIIIGDKKKDGLVIRISDAVISAIVEGRDQMISAPYEIIVELNKLRDLNE